MSWSPNHPDSVDALFERRRAPVLALADDARTVAEACHGMARRFHRGGKLVVFGNGGPSTDAQHVAVEFVHPVIVGKRALPALSLTADVATVTGVANRVGLEDVFAHQLRIIGEPADIALGISADGGCANVRRGLETARDAGMLTIALTGGDGGAIAATPGLDHVLVARSADPRVVKEVHVTTYHVLWELVHVFFEQPGVLTPEVAS
ncbi:SIS domain-containing protein [Amycolatopsis balhimycina DSM 5908]|uniref:SIS domain-containing protein n=1 Tax=Amycolatopsis balhimycina DSM 5908 TaxID=1081091 RepID=A0A428WFM6_AMYBA|nr:SIS domain-containing protein [Amycolatopsis balhimycina]RSM41862.1 SIS domain-containing protein [Amycolatopsis balhimycina DSM 5908]